MKATRGTHLPLLPRRSSGEGAPPASPAVARQPMDLERWWESAPTMGRLPLLCCRTMEGRCAGKGEAWG